MGSCSSRMIVTLLVMEPEEDLVTIQIQTREGYGIQQVKVEVEIKLLRRIGLFSDMLPLFNPSRVIPFPSQYSEVAMSYINFINGNYINDSQCTILKDLRDNNLLILALKLCHYLDDNCFLTFLVDYMHGNTPTSNIMSITVDDVIYKHTCLTTWLQHQHVIDELPTDLQRDIYLLCPFTHVPVRYQSDQNFVKVWFNIHPSNNCIKKGKKVKIVDHVVDDEYYYYTIIEFYDEQQTDIQAFMCKRRIKLNTFSHTFAFYGLTKIWYPLVKKETTTSNVVKCVKEEQLFNGVIKHGYHKMWFDNGKLYKSSCYENNKKHGYDFDYYRSGKLAQQCCYNNDKPTGTWFQWYKSGNLQTEINFDDTGVKHGYYRDYYDVSQKQGFDACLQHEYCFDHGEETGMFRSWYPPRQNGKVHRLEYEYNFIGDGQYSYREWYSNGKIRYDFSYNGDDTTIPIALRDLIFGPYLSETGNIIKYCFHR